MQELLQKADQWIEANRERLIRDITRLVNIRSVSGPDGSPHPFGQGCRDVLDEMFRVGRELGFEARDFEGRCGALWLMEGEENIGIWGHLDVVPEGDNWQYSPFDVVEKDGFLFGRGVDDNKGPAVAGLYAIKALHEAGIPLKRGLKLFVGLNEEAGMEDVAYYRENYPCPQLSIIPDAAFPVCYAEKGLLEASFRSTSVGEGNLLDIKGGIASNVVPDYAEAHLRKAGGMLEKLSHLPEQVEAREEADSIVVSATGLTRHVAFPEGGVNAIYLLTSALADAGVLTEDETRILRFFNTVNADFAGTGAGIACEDEISGPLTCVGSMIFLEDGCLRLHMNIRYPVSAKLEDLLEGMKSAGSKYGCKLETDRQSDPSYFPREHELVDRLTRIFNEYAGTEETPYVMGGGTYARMLPNAFAFGMGLPGERKPQGLPDGHGGAHQPDEYVFVDDLITGIKIYCRALVALDGMPFPKDAL